MSERCLTQRREVCFEKPKPEGGYTFACQTFVELEPLHKSNLPAVYRVLASAKLGIAAGWRLVNYGKRYRVSAVRPANAEVVEVTCSTLAG